MCRIDRSQNRPSRLVQKRFSDLNLRDWVQRRNRLNAALKVREVQFLTFRTGQKDFDVTGGQIRKAS